MSLPRLLDGTLINGITLSVNQSVVPLSNATLEVFEEDALPIRTYVEISTPNGITEVYRTRQPQISHDTGIATIQLDHAVCEVGDYLIQGVINEEQVLGQALSTVFAHYRGDRWQLSDNIPSSVSVIIDCDHDNVLETMLSLLEQAPDYYMTFDFTTAPKWTICIAEKSSTVQAEGRMSRNIASATVRRDDKDLCTRVYVKGLPVPDGSGEDAIGYMDADTVSVYGIVEKETGSGDLTEEQATKIATAYLNAHKNPKFSVELTGDVLKELTGEDLDAFICGRKFRFAIENQAPIEDYITKVHFTDVISSDEANIVIGDDLDPIINFLQDQKSTSRSSRRNSDDIIQLYREFTSSDGMLHSYVLMNASRLETMFTNAATSLSSRITQTAEEINSSVWGEESSIYSQLKMTATHIMTSVGDDIEDIHTEILQTKSMIRNSVWTANSTVFTYIEQTASYILDHVGERSGSKVIPSMTEPQDTQENPLSTGDIWVEGSLINTWDDFQEGTPWVDYDPTAYQYDWLELSGQKVHVWKDGKWNLVEDGTKLVEDTWFLRTKDTIGMIAGNVEKIDGEFRKNLAELEVKADRISSTVTQHGKDIGELGSNITQTATQIRSEVHAANSTLYSAIEQTATNIRMEVANTVSGLRSVIEQTAGQIRTEVSNTVSGLNSTITQNSDKISLVVRSTSSGYTVDSASIVAGINDQSGSYVKIKAKTIDLSGYVTAAQLEVTDAKISNLTSGATTASSLKTNLLSASTGFTYQSHSVSFNTITISGTTYHLLGYT